MCFLKVFNNLSRTALDRLHCCTFKWSVCDSIVALLSTRILVGTIKTMSRQDWIRVIDANVKVTCDLIKDNNSISQFRYFVAVKTNVVRRSRAKQLLIQCWIFLALLFIIVIVNYCDKKKITFHENGPFLTSVVFVTSHKKFVIVSV